ncbi:hypothetical protein H6G10_05865 [Anabaena cylindrica FACHB-170]|uniref:hypothetical protein n=1 Tax=Anabaena sp. FACHB-709 TaxID=1086822 RepID=UPI00000CE026|nr:hypothetical protein [Anabaena sp. FACHB-709]MBD2282742.1 hypothetical protein [Anabaena cylindrica FACHB-170]BAB73206.1 asl1249 [Nostoc sp. PCC 7120 = FACHB-418]
MQSISATLGKNLCSMYDARLNTGNTYMLWQLPMSYKNLIREDQKINHPKLTVW